MLADISRIVVLAMGAAICVFAAWGVYAPQELMRLLKGIMEKDWAIHLAIAVRLAMGIALIFAAPESRFPLAFLILGWVAIAAGVAVALMGRQRLRRFINWWIERFSPAGIRLWLLFAIAFGGILIYGVT